MSTNAQITDNPQAVNAALFTPSSDDDGAGADLRECRERVVALEQERDRLRALVERLNGHIDHVALRHIYWCQSTHETGLPCDCGAEKLELDLRAALNAARVG